MKKKSVKKQKKKTTSKTSKKSAKARSPLKKVQGELIFRLANGHELSSILDLAHILDHIPDDIYHHHVSHDRNDFSNWIKDVFDIEELAHDIRQATRHEAQIKIFKHLLDEHIKMLKKVQKELDK